MNDWIKAEGDIPLTFESCPECGASGWSLYTDYEGALDSPYYSFLCFKCGLNLTGGFDKELYVSRYQYTDPENILGVFLANGYYFSDKPVLPYLSQPKMPLISNNQWNLPKDPDAPQLFDRTCPDCREPITSSVLKPEMRWFLQGLNEGKNSIVVRNSYGDLVFLGFVRLDDVGDKVVERFNQEPMDYKFFYDSLGRDYRAVENDTMDERSANGQDYYITCNNEDHIYASTYGPNSLRQKRYDEELWKEGAVDLGWWSNFVVENPYMLHFFRDGEMLAEEDPEGIRSDNIRNNGLIPYKAPLADAPDTNFGYDDLAPRPGHTYLMHPAFHYSVDTWDTQYDSVAVVNTAMLDPARVNPDEDWFRHNFTAWSESQGYPSISAGDWAESVDLSDPSQVKESLTKGSLAYKGWIPPEAIEEIFGKDELQTALRQIQNPSPRPYDPQVAPYIPEFQRSFSWSGLPKEKRRQAGRMIESDWGDKYKWSEDGTTRLPATNICCGKAMKEVSNAGFPYYYCTQCQRYQKKSDSSGFLIEKVGTNKEVWSYSNRKNDDPFALCSQCENLAEWVKTGDGHDEWVEAYCEHCQDLVTPKTANQWSSPNQNQIPFFNGICPECGDDCLLVKDPFAESRIRGRNVVLAVCDKHTNYYGIYPDGFVDHEYESHGADTSKSPYGRSDAHLQQQQLVPVIDQRLLRIMKAYALGKHGLDKQSNDWRNPPASQMLMWISCPACDQEIQMYTEKNPTGKSLDHHIAVCPNNHIFALYYRSNDWIVRELDQEAIDFEDYEPLTTSNELSGEIGATLNYIRDKDEVDRSLFVVVPKAMIRTANEWQGRPSGDQTVLPLSPCPKCDKGSYLITHNGGDILSDKRLRKNWYCPSCLTQWINWSNDGDVKQHSTFDTPEELEYAVRRLTEHRLWGEPGGLKYSNEWTNGPDPNQLQLLGCPSCGSTDLFANLDDYLITIDCDNCGETIPMESFKSWNDKWIEGNPALVQYYLSQGNIDDGPSGGYGGYEFYIEKLVQGIDNSSFNDEAADALYQWAKISGQLDELRNDVNAVLNKTSEEISEWTIDNMSAASHYGESVYTYGMIEDMSDEQLAEAFGEGTTREDALGQAEEDEKWFWEEAASNYGLYQAAKYLKELIGEDTN
jgi:hypothetical protein